MTTSKIEFNNVCKSFDPSRTAAAVTGLNLQVEAGETLALLGPSGCGKSTTLNMVAGLESPTSGDIRIDGRSVLSVPPGQRNVGLVFQDYAVFTHMTVRDNLEFGLVVRGMPRRERQQRVLETAQLLDLAASLDKSTRALGGSELQRVAIGRTLATRPDILLLDEPLSNLEAAARLAMRRELRRLQAQIGLTIIYVTHDQVEALCLADRIAVMSEGCLRQVADTSTIYNFPGHLFVASFIGSPPMNLLSGRLGQRGQMLVLEQGDDWTLLGEVDSAAAYIGRNIVLGIRPELLRVCAPEGAACRGRVLHVECRGAEAVVGIDSPQGKLKVVVPARSRPKDGEHVGVSFARRDWMMFDRDSGQRLPTSQSVVIAA